MNSKYLQGLIAATYTPLDEKGEPRLAEVAPMVESLLVSGISGLYVCGSTGEGMSLTSDARKEIAAAYVRAANKRVPVIVQVGHNSIAEARELARHAQDIGADITSATCPSYFKVGNVETLVDCMAQVAEGAPELPFYYYHIPALTGSTLDMVKFLRLGGERIPNLAGLKYTATMLHEFQECLEFENGRYDVVWGCDEMLLGALATGARAAIGSTYNIAASLYHDIMVAFEEGNIVEARRLQSRSIEMIRTIGGYPFHPAMKAVLKMQGFEMGGCLRPQEDLSITQIRSLEAELKAIGFFEWSQPKLQNTTK